MNAQPAPATAAPFDIVAIVASAGGLNAITAVLADLPAGFPGCVLVGQHLGAESALVEILERRIELAVEWAQEGAPLLSGRVYVCPPHRRVEVLPDRTFSLIPYTRDLLQEMPLDALLASVADCYGSRALAVVLTGMGRDAAAGARALRAAGGAVIIQSEESAAYPSMPRAVSEAAGADLVLPLPEIGKALQDLLAGGRFPHPRNEEEAREALFAGDGEACMALRAVDWSATAAGNVREWSPSVKSVVATMLHSCFPTCIFLGGEFLQVYNDAWISILGGAHPGAAGLPARATWSETWVGEVAGLRSVLQAGQASYSEDQLFEVQRHGFAEEAYFTISHSPVHDEQGAVQAVLTIATETTERVIAARRQAMLRALAAAAAGGESVAAACETIGSVLAESPRDLPFALLYVADLAGLRTTLNASVGLRAGSGLAPHAVDLENGASPWPLAKVLRTGAPLLVERLDARLRGFHAGPWPERPHSAMLLPLRVGDGGAGAVLVAGLSPRVPLDTSCREFLDLLGQQVGANLAEARLRERERERLAQLAELARTRSEFFSNVSHEFRTPLTLILAPLEDLLGSNAGDSPLHRELEVASRNARRLLHLVDTLLDVSQLEAGRLRAAFRELDLAALTRDIAALFRSAIERAGLRFEVDCPPLPQPVRVDPGMWEKIVSNLLSNALKFTFAGSISLRLRSLAQHVELVVSDTGVGIPEEELPYVFRRFHRVRGARARTDEGAGIGLALVHELVQLHHGRIRVRSTPGEGSTFTVWLVTSPAGGRPVAAGVGPVREEHRTAQQLAGEAERWGAAVPPAMPAGSVVESMAGSANPALPVDVPGARLLVVDDNADMREYLARSLGAHWQVTLAADGAQALAEARRERPDLVLADVMMPVLDGFALLRELRADPELKATPVVLVTARAHEEAAIEGLLAGADDYIAKPFSSRELVARVGAQLVLAGVRRQGERQVRALLAMMPVGVYACDRDGRFAYWNRRAVELWGSEPGVGDREWALCGAPRVIDADGRAVPPDASPMAQVLRTGAPVEDRELIALRDDGARLEILVNIRPLREGSEVTGAVAAFLDVTGRKQAERSLQVLNEELEQRVADRTATLRRSEASLSEQLTGMQRLYDLHARLANETNLRRALDEILAAACEFTGTDRGCVQLVSDDGERLEMFAWRGYTEESPFVRRFRHEGFEQGCDVASVERRRLVIEDTRTFPGLEGTAAGADVLADGILAAQSTPMVSRKGETVGVLSTQFREAHRPSEEQLRMVDLLAWTAADFVEHHRAEAGLAAEFAGIRLLNEFGARMAGEQKMGVMYEEVLDAAIRLARADAGTLQVLDEPRQELLMVAHRGFPPAMAAKFGRVDAGSFTPCGLALLNNGRAFVDYTTPEAEDDESLRLHRDLGLAWGQSTPLVARTGRVVGMFSTHSRRRARPQEYELHHLDLLARLAADLLETRHNALLTGEGESA